MQGLTRRLLQLWPLGKYHRSKDGRLLTWNTITPLGSPSLLQARPGARGVLRGLLFQEAGCKRSLGPAARLFDLV